MAEKQSSQPTGEEAGCFLSRFLAWWQSSHSLITMLTAEMPFSHLQTEAATELSQQSGRHQGQAGWKVLAGGEALKARE